MWYNSSIDVPGDIRAGNFASEILLTVFAECQVRCRLNLSVSGLVKPSRQLRRFLAGILAIPGKDINAVLYIVAS